MSIHGPLSGVIFLLAQEQADEIAGLNQNGGDEFAALIRDGSDLARRTRDLIETDQVDVGAEAVEPDDWASLERAAGVIVRRDPEGKVTVEPFETDDDLAAAWSAVMVELEPEEPGSPQSGRRSRTRIQPKSG